MRYLIRILRRAENDIEEVLAYTLQHFGETKYDAYRKLIRAAFDDLSLDPQSKRSRSRPELHPQARTYHIGRRGSRARHFLLYRLHRGAVEIARFLHDSMDLQQHVPPDYLPEE